MPGTSPQLTCGVKGPRPKAQLPRTKDQGPKAQGPRAQGPRPKAQGPTSKRWARRQLHRAPGAPPHRGPRTAHRGPRTPHPGPRTADPAIIKGPMKTAAAETGKQRWEREVLEPTLKKAPERPVP